SRRVCRRNSRIGIECLQLLLALAVPEQDPGRLTPSDLLPVQIVLAPLGELCEHESVIGCGGRGLVEYIGPARTTCEQESVIGCSGRVGVSQADRDIPGLLLQLLGRKRRGGLSSVI